jgi:hypothetical protein
LGNIEQRSAGRPQALEPAEAVDKPRKRYPRNPSAEEGIKKTLRDGNG